MFDDNLLAKLCFLFLVCTLQLFNLVDKLSLYAWKNSDMKSKLLTKDLPFSNLFVIPHVNKLFAGLSMCRSQNNWHAIFLFKKWLHWVSTLKIHYECNSFECSTLWSFFTFYESLPLAISMYSNFDHLETYSNAVIAFELEVNEREFFRKQNASKGNFEICFKTAQILPNAREQK